MKNLFLSIVVVCALVVAGVGGVLADWTEDDTADYCLQAGYLNLVLDLDDVELDFDDIGTIICDEYLEPGDDGEETLSFHLYGDDTIVSAELVIYGTMTDAEMTRHEPEETAGDTTDVGGELQDFLMVELWWDDGDNIWQQGEVIIFSGTLDELMDCLGEAGGHSLGQIDECTTYYIGIYYRLAHYDDPGGVGEDVNQCMSDKAWGELTFEVTNPVHGPP